MINEFGQVTLQFTEDMFDQMRGFNLSMINNETMVFKLIDFESLNKSESGLVYRYNRRHLETNDKVKIQNLTFEPVSFYHGKLIVQLYFESPFDVSKLTKY